MRGVTQSFLKAHDKVLRMLLTKYVAAGTDQRTPKLLRLEEGHIVLQPLDYTTRSEEHPLRVGSAWQMAAFTDLKVGPSLAPMFFPLTRTVGV